MLINEVEGPEPQPGAFRWATVTSVGDYDLVVRLGAECGGAEREKPNPLVGAAVSAAPNPVPSI